MPFVWNALALADLVAFATTGTFAVIIYAAGPTRPQNRRLAVFLAILGGLRGAEALRYLASDAGAYVGATLVGLLTWLALFPAYLAFLATVDSPLSRPLRGRAGNVALVGLALLVIPRKPGSRQRSGR